MLITHKKCEEREEGKHANLCIRTKMAGRGRTPETTEHGRGEKLLTVFARCTLGNNLSASSWMETLKLTDSRTDAREGQVGCGRSAAGVRISSKDGHATGGGVRPGGYLWRTTRKERSGKVRWQIWNVSVTRDHTVLLMRSRT